MFQVSILTPQGIVAKDVEAKSVIVPTQLGLINILPKHTHILAQMTTGTIELIDAKGSKRYYSSTAGIVKVLGEKITLLLKTSESAEVIDLQRAKKAKELAQAKLKEFKNLQDPNFIKFQRKLQRAKVREKLAQLHK